MKVVVSGGTGFIGSNLVRSMSRRGHDVVVLSRRSPSLIERCCSERLQGVSFHEWEPKRGGEWQKVVDGADAVVHLAGAGIFDRRWSEDRKRVLHESRIRSTELLAEAIARAERKPSVFVSGSAVGYYGVAAGAQELDEGSPAGDDFLGHLAVEWERAADAARAAGVRVAHPRMGLVLGRGGGLLGKLLPVFRAYLGGPLGDGDQYVAWVHLVDAVGALEHAVSSGLEGPFNVTAPEPVTMNEFATSLGEALRRPASVRVPTVAVKLALGEAAEAVLTGQRAYPRKLTSDRFAFVYPELRSALDDLVN